MSSAKELYDEAVWKHKQLKAEKVRLEKAVEDSGVATMSDEKLAGVIAKLEKKIDKAEKEMETALEEANELLDGILDE